MNIKIYLKICACLSLVWLINAGAVEPFQVDPGLVQQLFEKQDPNRQIPKRPFNLDELVGLLADVRLVERDAGELTRRYLAITYPAGQVSVLAVVRADIPMRVKQILLTAPPGSAQFSIHGNLRELLAATPPALLDKILETPALTPRGEMEIAPLLDLNQESYTQNPYYFTYVPMREADGTSYTLSTPRPAKHRLAAFLDKTRDTTLSYRFVAGKCAAKTCESQAKGESFASFEFTDYGAACVEENQEVVADCRYEGGFRRDYVEHTEIEFRFKDCRLSSVEGKTPDCPELLRTLREVK